MNIRKILILGTIATAFAVSAQNQSTSTSSLPQANGTAATGQSFTNRVGSVYSTDQLAARLQNLRSSIESTLPLLSSYMESVSNTTATTTGGRGIGGAVTEILSGVLNRNTNQNNSYQGQGTNVVRVLQGLLGSSASANENNATSLKDLNTLQSQLQSLNSTLQRLNVGTNVTINLTPTGR